MQDAFPGAGRPNLYDKKAFPLMGTVAATIRPSVFSIGSNRQTLGTLPRIDGGGEAALIRGPEHAEVGCNACLLSEIAGGVQNLTCRLW